MTEPPPERILSLPLRGEGMDEADVLRLAGPPARVFSPKDAPAYVNLTDGCFATPEGQRYLVSTSVWRRFPGLVWRALDVRTGMIVMCVNRLRKIARTETWSSSSDRSSALLHMNTTLVKMGPEAGHGGTAGASARDARVGDRRAGNRGGGGGARGVWPGRGARRVRRARRRRIAEDRGFGDLQPVSQEYTLTAGGTNMWARRDEFHFAWKRMTGDFILQARVELLGKGVDPHRKLGWIVRRASTPTRPTSTPRCMATA